MIAVKYQRTPVDVTKVQLTMRSADDFANCLAAFSAWGIAAYSAAKGVSMSMSDSQASIAMSQKENWGGRLNGDEFRCSQSIPIPFATPTHQTGINDTDIARSFHDQTLTKCSPCDISGALEMPETQLCANQWTEPPPKLNTSLFDVSTQQETVLYDQQDAPDILSQFFNFSQNIAGYGGLETPCKTPNSKSIKSVKGIAKPTSKPKSRKSQLKHKSVNVELNEKLGERDMTNLQDYIARRLKDNEFKQLVSN